MPVKLWYLLGLSLVACSAGKTSNTAQPAADTGPVEEDTINTSGMELVKGLAISEIAMFQGPKVSLEKDGAKISARRAQVISAREGVLRVYVKRAADWAPRDVVATLTLENGAGKKVINDTKAPDQDSIDDILSTTFNFDIEKDVITPDTTFSVDLKTEPGQAAGGDTAASQYPADGSKDSLDAIGTGEKLQIKIVPVKYNADGSGRLPDVSEAQLERYRAGFHRFYPSREVEISVRDPYPWSSAITRSGSGFGNLLNAIIRLRQSDGAPKGMYYFGAFAAGATFEGWCQYGCVAGLSPLAQNPSDTWTAASVGVGWTGEFSVGSAVHEVGHGHGRNHSPCAPGGMIDGVDPKYPYSGAVLGVWGYDVGSKGLVNPNKSKDFMGYCDPTFVSDYTFGALATRMQYVYGAKFMIPAPAQAWRMIEVDGDGNMIPGEEVVTTDVAEGEPRPVVLSFEGGKKIPTKAAFYPYDHLPGGLLVVPVGTAKITAIEARDLVPGVVSKLSL
jgi:hypothetical protein